MPKLPFLKFTDVPVEGIMALITDYTNDNSLPPT
jgi:hypothetical protein